MLVCADLGDFRYAPHCPARRQNGHEAAGPRVRVTRWRVFPHCRGKVVKSNRNNELWETTVMTSRWGTPPQSLESTPQAGRTRGFVIVKPVAGSRPAAPPTPASPCANGRLYGVLHGHAMVGLLACTILLHNMQPWQHVCAEPRAIYEAQEKGGPHRWAHAPCHCGLVRFIRDTPPSTFQRPYRAQSAAMRYRCRCPSKQTTWPG